MRNSLNTNILLYGAKTDCCPSCKEKFKQTGITVVFKDVVECKGCGHIWVIKNDEDIIRFS